MLTKPVYGNCLFAALYLLLRGRAEKIVAVTSESPKWPHHYLCINKHGHALHFLHVHAHTENYFAPWWFEGGFVGVRKSEQERLLKETNRKVLWSVNKHVGLLILLAIYVILFLPWVFVWLIYTPKWTLMGAVQALRKRFRKREYIQ